MAGLHFCWHLRRSSMDSPVLAGLIIGGEPSHHLAPRPGYLHPQSGSPLEQRRRARPDTGYATHMDEVAKAAKYLKYGGHIGIALTGTASAAKVQEVCRAGETEACEKIRYTEAGSFVGGMGGGGVAVPLASRLAAAPICAAIGFGSGGIGGIVCGLVVVGGASYAGGEGGEWVGEWMGENIYEVRK